MGGANAIAGFLGLRPRSSSNSDTSSRRPGISSPSLTAPHPPHNTDDTEIPGEGILSRQLAWKQPRVLDPFYLFLRMCLRWQSPLPLFAGSRAARIRDRINGGGVPSAGPSARARARGRVYGHAARPLGSCSCSRSWLTTTRRGRSARARGRARSEGRGRGPCERRRRQVTTAGVTTDTFIRRRRRR